MLYLVGYARLVSDIYLKLSFPMWFKEILNQEPKLSAQMICLTFNQMVIKHLRIICGSKVLAVY